MASITTVRKGQALRLNGEVHIILEFNHRTPPNNRAFIQMKTRNLSNGKVAEHRFTPNDSVDVVNTSRDPHEYSYSDPSGYHFLHPETFEDVLVEGALVEPIKDYLIEGNSYELLFTDGAVASVELPASMEMKVAEAPEGVKGDSANNVYKAATMETGLVVQVPLFIKPGETIKVKTEDGTYQGRA